MGSYFITNDSSATDDAITFMKKKGLVRHRSYQAGSVFILSFDKLYIDSYNNIYKEGDDFILGFGTYFYKDRFAAEALKELFTDLKNGDSALANVLGHFSFVICKSGKCEFVTDKCGVYHGFGASQDDRFYVSNSMFAVADAVENLEAQPQECMEYLYTQATYGQKTIFKEINHLNGGTLYSLEPFTQGKQYYRPGDESVGFDDYMVKSRNYLAAYKNSEYKFNCDMSGGYDSRTVGSLLEYAGVDVSYNTNTNPTDVNDSLVAQELAKVAGREIEFFDRDTGDMEFAELVEKCFLEIEKSLSLTMSL